MESLCSSLGASEWNRYILLREFLEAVPVLPTSYPTPYPTSDPAHDPASAANIPIGAPDPAPGLIPDNRRRRDTNADADVFRSVNSKTDSSFPLSFVGDVGWAEVNACVAVIVGFRLDKDQGKVVYREELAPRSWLDLGLEELNAHRDRDREGQGQGQGQGGGGGSISAVGGFIGSRHENNKNDKNNAKNDDNDNNDNNAKNDKRDRATDCRYSRYSIPDMNAMDNGVLEKRMLLDCPDEQASES